MTPDSNPLPGAEPRREEPADGAPAPESDLRAASMFNRRVCIGGALTAGGVLAGMVLEAAFRPFGRMLPTGPGPEAEPAPLPAAGIPAEVIPTGLLTPEQVPAPLRRTHAFIRGQEALSAWYRGFVAGMELELGKFLESARAVSDDRAFRMEYARMDLRFPQREYEKRRDEFLSGVEKLIKEREIHLLCLLTAAGIADNPAAARRAAETDVPTYKAGMDVRDGWSIEHYAGLASPEQDASKLYSHGVARTRRSHLVIDLKDSYPWGDFLKVLFHEETHGILQAARQEEKQSYRDFFGDVIELTDQPFYRHKSGLYLHNEFLYEGITEVLAQRACALSGCRPAYVSYQPIAALASMLMALDEKAVLDWYMGHAANQGVYEALHAALTRRKVPPECAAKLLGLVFQDKVSYQKEDPERAAAVLGIALERAGNGLDALTASVSLPENVRALVKGRQIGKLAGFSDAELHACLQDGYREVRPSGSIEVNPGHLASYLLMSNPKDAAALSALAAYLTDRDQGHTARRLLRSAIELDPGAALHHLRMARTFKVLPYPSLYHGTFGRKLDRRETEEIGEKCAACERALKIEPDNRQAMFELAVVRLKHALAAGPGGDAAFAEHCDRAVQGIKTALSDPGSVPGWRNEIEKLLDTGGSFRSDCWGKLLAACPKAAGELKAVFDQAAKTR